MATKLKDLKFGDYTLKGVENGNHYGINYKLGSDDALTYEYISGGVTQEDKIIDRSWSLGCSSAWRFHGWADYAGCAKEVEVIDGDNTQGKNLHGKSIPTLDKSGSSATVDELENWITTFVGLFDGGSTYVITGTYNP